MGLLKSEYPDIFKQLHPQYNSHINTAKITSKSHKNLWWYCQADPEFSHFFKDSVANRTKHGTFRCKICESAGGKRKDLLSHWDYSHYVQPFNYRNGRIWTLFDVRIGSTEKAHWRCPKGHVEPELWSIAAKAARGQGKKQKQKPICTRCHSIVCTHPEIAKLFDQENNVKDVWDITAGVADEVNWKCDKGHSYPMRVSTKVRDFKKYSGNGCNICSGHLIIAEINSLAAKFPSLLNEWHWEKNQALGISPYELGPGSNKNAYWICSKHKPYKATLGNRTHKTNPTSCPKCKSQTSRNELRIYFEFKAIFERVEHRLKDYGGEIDIYLPEYSLGIEYDGFRYHQNNVEKDKLQIERLKLKHIQLVRVREKPLKKLGEHDIVVKPNKLISHHDIAVLLENVLQLKSNELCQNIVSKCEAYIQDGIFIAEDEYVDTVINRFGVPFEQSLAAKFPEVANDWDLEKNFPYTADIITPGVAGNASDELFYWKCPVDQKHPSYPMRVYSRTGKSKQGCPRCAGRYATRDNNLELKHPTHAKMFNEAENFSNTGEPLVASMIKPNSGIKYDWVCPYGHLIQSKSPDEIVKNKEYLGCQICRQHAISSGTHKFAHQKFDDQEIIQLFKKRMTYKEISEKLGCSLGHVGNIVKKFKEENGIEVQSKVTKPIFCKEVNWHFHSHFEAKQKLRKLGYEIKNILAVLRGDIKTTGGLSFTYSDLNTEQINKQDPANYVDFQISKKRV